MQLNTLGVVRWANKQSTNNNHDNFETFIDDLKKYFSIRRWHCMHVTIFKSFRIINFPPREFFSITMIMMMMNVQVGIIRKNLIRTRTTFEYLTKFFCLYYDNIYLYYELVWERGDRRKRGKEGGGRERGGTELRTET